MKFKDDYNHLRSLVNFFSKFKFEREMIIFKSYYLKYISLYLNLNKLMFVSVLCAIIYAQQNYFVHPLTCYVYK